MSIPEYKSHIRDISTGLAVMRSHQPDVMKAFNDLAGASTAAGTLDTKTKELIALALGVAGHCDACIGFHIKALVKLGATQEEVEDALEHYSGLASSPVMLH